MFPEGKFTSWAHKGSCVEEIWKTFKETVFESIDRFVPHKILIKNPDPEYYNQDVKRLKGKVRRVYNKRIRGERYQVEMKRLSKDLLAAKKLHRRHFCCQYHEMKATAGLSFTSL
jgi:hypothetical protein